MWVMMTRRRASRVTPARSSFCIGLPPQSTSTASPSPTKTIEVVSRSRAGAAPAVPRNVKCTASGGRAGSAQEQGHPDEREGHSHYARELGDANRPEHEGVGAQRFREEAAHRVEAQVCQEQRAGRPLEPLAENYHEEEEHHQVPQRLVEERGMEVLVLRVLDGPMRRRDEKPPRQVRRRAEGLLVEEVAPAADGLTEGEARSCDVQVRDGGQSARERVTTAHEETADDAAVNGEAALPHREDFSREAKVVVEVEGHVIQSRADEPAEETELRGLEHAIGIETASTRLAIGEPEPETHRACHEDAVPAEAQGTELQSDRAGRVKHTRHLYGPASVLSNKSHISGQIR